MTGIDSTCIFCLDPLTTSFSISDQVLKKRAPQSHKKILPAALLFAYKNLVCGAFDLSVTDLLVFKMNPNSNTQ